MPHVSVVIPAHNAEPYLESALASVRAQTYPDWEIVAVDDGSTDGTWQILDGAGPRVKAARNETPLGPAEARNRALSMATGELVVFLDADDMLEPRNLESQIACLEAARSSGRRVGIVSCDAYLLEDGVRLPYTYMDTVRDRNKPITLERLLRRNLIYICSLVPRDAGASVGWFDPELFGTEDYGLWLKLLEQGYEAIRNPEPLATYRRRSASVSSDIARLGVNNRRAYELAIGRGGLTPRQRRIACRAIRYNRAMEAVATFRFAPQRERRTFKLLRLAPLLAWVALTNPRWWPQWIAVLRTGRVPSLSTRQ